MFSPRYIVGLFAACLTFLTAVPLPAASLADTIQRIKPSVVGIGTYQKTRNPSFVFLGTGFVVGDGNRVVTNNHVVPTIIDHENREIIAVVSGEGSDYRVMSADLLKRDSSHDLALLEIENKLKPISLAEAGRRPDGSDIAVTGYPIGMILGLYPVTHRGIIAAYVPIAIPPANPGNLTTQRIRALRNPQHVYQLDITAYPGNSGSPVFDPDSGKLLAVINSVFVKGSKEEALSAPSGISYAIPVEHVHRLLD